MATPKSLGEKIFYVDFTISAGEAVSTESVETGGGEVVGLIFPSSLDGASVTFSVSLDNTTFNNLYKADGTEYSVVSGINRYVVIDPNAFSGIRYVKIRSGTSGIPANQSAARTIYLVYRRRGFS